MRLKSMKMVGLTAALMLSASASAMAATLFVPTNGGVPLATELFGTSIVTPGGNNTVRIESSGAGTFTNSPMLLTITLTGGAQFNLGVVGGDLTGDEQTGFGAPDACPVVPTVTIADKGSAGDSEVTFRITNAQSCRALRLNLNGGLKGITQGANVEIGASLKTEAGTAIDGGVINSPLVYIKQIDGNSGSITAPVSHIIDLSTSSTKLVANGAGADTATATTFVSGIMVDKLAAAFAEVLDQPWLGAEIGATGVLTLSGLPSAVVAPPTLVWRPAATTATLTDAGVGTAIACTAPAANTSTCAFNAAAMNAMLAAAGTKSLLATFTVNGTTAIPPTTMNGKFVVSYATAANYVPIASETKFDGPIASLGLNACIAEFASIMNNPSSVSTIRLSNTTAVPSKVYVAATTDGGTGSAVIPVTLANVPTATLALDAGNLLKPGATIEMTGAQIAAATGQDFTSWSGVSRGRVRVYLETAASGATGSINASGNKAGCTAEGFTCVNGTCSIMQPTTLGKDGQPITAQNK